PERVGEGKAARRYACTALQSGEIARGQCRAALRLHRPTYWRDCARAMPGGAALAPAYILERLREGNAGRRSACTGLHTGEIARGQCRAALRLHRPTYWGDCAR